MPFYVMVLFVMTLVLSARPDEGWKVVCGEMSILSQIKGKIERNNCRSAFSYNTVSGEIRYLKSSFAGNDALKEEWVCVREPQPNAGGIEVIFAEHTLISAIQIGDVDGESFYCPFLLEKKTGKLWRLLVTYKPKSLSLSMKWAELPAPAPVERCI